MKYGGDLVRSLLPSQIIAQLPKNRFELVENNVPEDEDVSYFQEFGLEVEDLFGPYAKNPDSDILNTLVPNVPGAEAVLYVLFGGRGLYKEDLLEILDENYIRRNITPIKISRPNTNNSKNIGKKIIVDIQGELHEINTTSFEEDYETMMAGEGEILVCWVREDTYIKNIQPAAALREFSKEVVPKYNIPKNIIKSIITPMLIKGGNKSRKIKKTYKRKSNKSKYNKSKKSIKH